MKYLKIEKNKGYYWDGNKYQEIDKINRDGLLALLNAAESDIFELDAYDESLLGNKAHQVIYENIHSKFAQFLNDKNQFKSEVDNLYKEAIGKYSVNIQNESLDDTDNLKDKEEEVNPDDIPF
jgi:hypothetical protein